MVAHRPPAPHRVHADAVPVFCGAAAVARGGAGPRQKRLCLVQPAAGAGAGLAAGRRSHLIGGPMVYTPTLLSIIFIFPLVVWLGARRAYSQRQGARLSKFLGDISYPLYITHYPLISPLIRAG
ncbi:MAG: acyltransferase family protein [Hymenobacter sp.]